MDDQEEQTLHNLPNMPESPPGAISFGVAYYEETKRREAREAARLRRLARIRERKLNRPIPFVPNFLGSEQERERLRVLSLSDNDLKRF